MVPVKHSATEGRGWTPCDRGKRVDARNRGARGGGGWARRRVHNDHPRCDNDRTFSTALCTANALRDGREDIRQPLRADHVCPPRTPTPVATSTVCKPLHTLGHHPHHPKEASTVERSLGEQQQKAHPGQCRTPLSPFHRTDRSPRRDNGRVRIPGHTNPWIK